MLPAIILFAVTYVLMISFGKYRPYIALTSGVLFIIFGMLPVNQIIGALDFNVLLMIGGISNMGVIDALAQLLAKLGDGNPFLMYTIIVWASVLISAFIDNIPYVATMIPVIAGIAAEMGIDSTALYFGLLSGATLGGNCTPIGASANIAGIGILRKEGHEVKNSDFFKIGIPFTMAAVIPAYIVLWLLFGGM